MQKTTLSKAYQETPTLVRSYLRDIADYKRITPEEEKKLGKLIKNGDKEAFEKLINANLGLVIHLASRYRNKGVDYEDLISEGNVGLTIAASKWSYRRNIRFITYAYFWVKRQMLYALNNNKGQVKTPANLSSVSNTFDGLLKSIETRGSGKLSEQRIREMFGKKYKNHSIDTILHRLNTSYCNLVVSDVNGDSFERQDGALQTESFERVLENSDGAEKLKKKVEEILADTRYGDIVASMFGLKDNIERSGRAIARKNKVSVQTVHNWKLDTYKKFKKRHKEKEFADYLKVD